MPIDTPITSAFNVPRLVCGRDTSELSTVVTAAKPESALFWGTCSDASGGDAETATQAMISGNRGNNSLGRVIIDADLMPLASEPARATAAGDRMGCAFQERMCKAGFGGSAAVENVGAPRHSPAGAMRRRIAPTCLIGASPAWGSPRPMRLARRCSSCLSGQGKITSTDTIAPLVHDAFVKAVQYCAGLVIRRLGGT
jgi:hypothetical protein